MLQANQGWVIRGSMLFAQEASVASMTRPRKGGRCAWSMVRRRREALRLHLAEENQMCHRGMMKAIAKDEWVEFQAATQLSLQR